MYGQFSTWMPRNSMLKEWSLTDGVGTVDIHMQENPTHATQKFAQLKMDQRPQCKR